MNLTALLMLVTCMHLYAGVSGQKVSLNARDASLEDVFKQIRKQTNFLFVYDLQAVKKAGKVSLAFHDVPINEAMDLCLKEQPFSYTIVNKTIVLKPKKDVVEFLVPPINVSGIITNESGAAVAGVSVVVKGTTKGTTTNEKGEFSLTGVDENATLVISGVNIERIEIKVGGRSRITASVTTSVSSLDETVVKGYYTTTKRSNTGSVGTISQAVISNQPVVDPIGAMQGRVAGVMIASNSGMPGASYQVRIRGENSMISGNDPLYIVDGVPFISTPINQFKGANGSQSPLSSINPADIERMDILKDADATAIYGSKGTNGVVLITTKKGKTGESKFDLNILKGISNIGHRLDMLNTQQYLQLREEAFANDAATKTLTNAPDFLIWDKNAYTDWQDLLLGNTAQLTEAQASFSGGNAQTRFLLSGAFRNEGTVLLGDFSYKRGTTHINIDHASKDNKFGLTASINFAVDRNNIVPTDVSQYINLPPNMPVYKNKDSLYWFGSLQNPVAYLKRTYETKTINMIGNSTLRYNILKNLTVRTNLGYTFTTMNQFQALPAAGYSNLTAAPASQAQYGTSSVNSYIIEPQIDYNTYLGIGKLSLLAGGTWQQTIREGNYFLGSGYASDAQLRDISAAASISLRNNQYAQYNYQSFYGRINYDISSKYIVNLTVRTDGSSRFSNNNRYDQFGAVGAAWIFTEENFAKNNLSFLSFGKLRGSFGVTGNDQIDDYVFLDSWAPPTYPYGGLTGLYPEKAFNPDFSWEKNKKLEATLELGFLRDQIFLTSTFYRNRSDNQLVGQTLSPQSGFSDFQANFPAMLENKGWEFDLTTINVNNKNFRWTSSFNITLPKNKLLEYKDLDKSGDATAYAIGSSTRLVKGFQFTGVNPTTGVPEFLDVNDDGVVDQANDWVVLGELLPKFYGGFSNELSYKGFSLDIFFQFVKQEAPTVDWGPLAGAYGGLSNKTTVVLDRWKKAGDIVSVPRATVTAANPANSAFRSYYRTSSAVWGDASYIRLKNVSLRYDLSAFTKKWKIASSSIYVQGQNLFTITNYNGLDPEANGFDRSFVFPINPFGSIKSPAVPVLRTITVGVKVSI